MKVKGNGQSSATRAGDSSTRASEQVGGKASRLLPFASFSPRSAISYIGMLLDRSRFLSRGATTFDGKRDVYKQLGYAPNGEITPQEYRQRYDRGDIAGRVVDAYPDAAWEVDTEIIEDEDPKILTPFERDIASLVKRLNLWSTFQRADVLASLSQYSVLLIGARGVLEQPLPRMTGPGDVLYLRPIGEGDAPIESSVTDPSDPRFGLPLFYNVSVGGVAGSIESKRSHRVHFSRVIHFAKGLLDDEVNGAPVLERVWNKLDDLDKVVGGGAEAAWAKANPGLHANLDPEAKLDDDEEAAMQEHVDEYVHGLTRFLQTRGVDIKELGGSPYSFGSNAKSVLELIAGALKIPVRLLLGTERGELASSQDDDNWNDAVTAYRKKIEPIVRDFVNRLLDAGAIRPLRRPAGSVDATGDPVPDTDGDLPAESVIAVDFQILWPEIEELNETEKGEAAASLATANQAMAESTGEVLMTAAEVRDRIYGLDPLPPEQAKAFTAKVQEEASRREDEAMKRGAAGGGGPAGAGKRGGGKSGMSGKGNMPGRGKMMDAEDDE